VKPLVQVCFGPASITPPLPCRLTGYARRDRPSREVSQHLSARSIVVDNGASRMARVICDLLDVSRSLVSDARTAVAVQVILPRHALMVCATHTHAGPELYQGREDDYRGYHDSYIQYGRFLPHAIACSVVSAVADLSPSFVSWAETSVEGVGVSRRGDPARPQRLGVLCVSVDDRVKGLIIVCPYHGNVVGPKHLKVSGDIIGACVRAFEEGTGATGHCAWAQGAAGDISTRATRRERSAPEADRLGSLVSAVGEGTAGEAKPVADPQLLSLGGVTVSLPRKTGRILGTPRTSALKPRSESDRSDGAVVEEAMAADEGRRRGTHEAEDVAELSLMQIGQLNLYSFRANHSSQSSGRSSNSVVPGRCVWSGMQMERLATYSIQTTSRAEATRRWRRLRVGEAGTWMV
jgi:hypothetical protein